MTFWILCGVAALALAIIGIAACMLSSEISQREGAFYEVDEVTDE